MIDVNSPFGIIELHDCLAFDNAFVQTAILTSGGDHDSVCNTNDGCGSADSPGCCRIHNNLLRCDVTNDFFRQPVSKRLAINKYCEYHMKFQSPCSHMLSFSASATPSQGTSQFQLQLLPSVQFQVKTGRWMGVLVMRCHPSTTLVRRSIPTVSTTRNLTPGNRLLKCLISVLPVMSA